MKEKTMKIIIAVLAVLLVAVVSAYAATNYGSREDPLITKSYLDEVVKPQLESDLQEKLDEAASEMIRSAPGEFAQVDLKSGQSILCAAGSQLLPVEGTVKSTAELADTTEGRIASASVELSLNHLYLVTELGGVSAESNATVLVSGTYRVE